MAYVFRAEVGQIFNLWTIIDSRPIYSEDFNPNKTKVVCQCHCGVVREVLYHSIRSGKSKSCGCSAIQKAKEIHTTHSMGNTPIYKSWQKMKYRCLNPNSKHFHRYGGRGIKISTSWLTVENFIEDMLPTWFEGATLERIDNNGDYSVENCRWATRKEQAQNRVSNVNITYKGLTKNVREWETYLGWSRGTLSTRLDRGWELNKAFETPVKHKSLKAGVQFSREIVEETITKLIS